MEGVVTRTAEKSAVRSEEVPRFDIHQRIQHLGLMVSFILLALTGLPLKFHDWQVSRWWVDVWGGIDNLRWVHHYAAWVMVVVCVYHLGYIAYSIIVLKRPFPVKIIPNYRDFANLLQEFRYFLGFTKERPKYDRFNWREKFDYWAIFWGIPVMAGSGFVLMYPVFATEVLPGWMVPVSLVAHSDEALLAVVWIFTVHFVFNHLAPGVIPLNKSIFTGKIPRERYRLEHPLEYEEMYGSAFIDRQQKSYGHMERAERDVHMDKLMARLAMVVCAADGQIDKRESAIVRTFFEQRLAYHENTAQYKAEINRVLGDGMRDIRGEATDPKEYVRSLCQQIAELNEPRISQETYELCAQVVAADQQAVEEKRHVLTKIAETLEIPDKLAREIDSRYFTMAMFQRQS